MARRDPQRIPFIGYGILFVITADVTGSAGLLAPVRFPGWRAGFAQSVSSRYFAGAVPSG